MSESANRRSPEVVSEMMFVSTVQPRQGANSVCLCLCAEGIPGVESTKDAAEPQCRGRMPQVRFLYVPRIPAKACCLNTSSTSEVCGSVCACGPKASSAGQEGSTGCNQGSQKTITWQDASPPRAWPVALA